MDTYDYNSHQKSNLKTGGGFDELRILIDPQRRNTLAKKCVRSVGKELQQRVQQFKIPRVILEPDGPMIGEMIIVETGRIEKMFDPLIPNFEAGLLAGAEELKQYLQELVRKYTPKPAWSSAVPRSRDRNRHRSLDRDRRREFSLDKDHRRGYRLDKDHNSHLHYSAWASAAGGPAGQNHPTRDS